MSLAPWGFSAILGFPGTNMNYECAVLTSTAILAQLKT